MRRIAAGAWTTQPWRNGGGVTHEILRWPDGPDFALRVSLAEIAAAGPFSAFPGLARWLALVDGGGLDLDIAGQGLVHLAAPGHAVRFAGEASVHARLPAGPVRVLNVMGPAARPLDVSIVDAPGLTGAPTPLAIVMLRGHGLVADDARAVELGPLDTAAFAGEPAAPVRLALAGAALAAWVYAAG